MNRASVEVWTHSLLRRIERGQPIEDSGVELKREWITDHQKAARRIAAHANAAYGQPILWLFGVDETTGVVGFQPTEMADWWACVKKSFDDTAPEIIANYVIETPRGPVVAVVFSTDAAPFVVKTGSPGSVTHEVPWREGNATRSAARRHLLAVLAPRVLLPDVEFVSGDTSLSRIHLGPGSADTGWCFNFRLRLYIAPRSAERVTIPRHRCRVAIEIGSRPLELLQHTLQLLPPQEPRTETERALAPFDYAGPEDEFLPPSLSVKATRDEAIVEGPGFLRAHGSVLVTDSAVSEQCEDQLHIQLALTPAGANVPVAITADLRFSERFVNQTWWLYP